MPLFISVYFVIAYIPILTKTGTEYFPFFTFKLYSKVPNGFEKYDLVIDDGCSEPFNLLYGSKRLTKLERKFYNVEVARVANEFKETGDFDLSGLRDALVDAKSVELVRLEGNYVEMLAEGRHQRELMHRIEQ